MENFSLIPTKTFLQDLKVLPQENRKSVGKALDKIKQSPFSGRKLSAVKIGQWRWRVGDYRIRYDIDRQNIILHWVFHRKDIYR